MNRKHDVMFDDDYMFELVPLSAMGNVERAEELSDLFLSDLRLMSDRPHQIDIWMLPFDEVPRRWAITPLSDDELGVVDPQHRVVVTVRDSLDHADICFEVAHLTPTALNTVPVWNDMLAVIGVVEAVEQGSASARAGAIEALAVGWQWDIGWFMEAGASLPAEMQARVLETMTVGSSAALAARDLNGSTLAGHELDRDLLLAAAESCRTILDQVVGVLIRGTQKGLN